MKIFDCFTYFDEDMLLDFRLNVLNSYVDKFVIVEAREDHQGNKKKLNFKINKFKKFKNKIIYIVQDKIEIDKNTILAKNWHPAHLKDQAQRNYIMQGLHNANPDDLIIISDLDEIPNPKSISLFNHKDKFAVFEQKNFCYKFNLIYSDYKWYGSRICVKKYLLSPQWLRNKKIYSKSLLKKFIYKFKIIPEGGWHFSYLKSPKQIVKKINSFCHGELNKSKFKNIKKINEKIKNGKNLYSNEKVYNKVKLDNSFPVYLLKNKKKYKNWIV